MERKADGDDPRSREYDSDSDSDDSGEDDGNDNGRGRDNSDDITSHADRISWRAVADLMQRKW